MRTTFDNSIQEMGIWYVTTILFLLYIALICAYCFFSITLETCLLNAVVNTLILFFLYKIRINNFPPIQINESGMNTTKGTFIRWDEMEISLMSSLFNYEEVFKIKNKNNVEMIITVNLENRKKFVRLIKNYCPADHRLYEIASNYAIKYKLPF